METDKRKTVYDVLKEKTGYRDSYEDFNKIIDKNVDARNKVYNVLKDKTGYKDSFDDFNKVIGAITSSPVDQNDTSPTAPVNPTVDNTNNPTSRFVQGKGKDTTIFGVPYRIYKHLTPESQSLYYQQALDKEKQNVADAISNQAESVQKQAEEAYDARANKINEDNIKFKKEHPFLNFIKEMAQMGRPVPLEPTLEDTDKDLRTLQGVVESAQTAKQTISEAGKKGNTNFVGGLGRGMRDMAGRGSTWDMGVLDLNRNVALSSAANKYINGQELNKTEKLLLRGAAIEQVAMDEFSSDLGRGYKMGSTTVQSLPFMAEFLINPLSGSGKAIGKGVMKQGLKAIGKELPAGMLGKVANGATRVLGDVTAATGMALTTGSVHTTADFVDRKNGNIDYLVDEDGQVKYDGHTGGVGTGEAAYKAIASSVIENLSEMSGSYFDVLGKGVNSLTGKAVEKSALVKRLGNAVNTSKVAELYRNVSSSELAKTVTDFERKTGFHGTIEEYGEEVVGTVLNAIFTGDQSFSDLSDVDQQIDTFLGVSGIGGLFSAVKTVGYRAPLHRVNREIGKLNKKLSVSMGEDWSGVSDVLQSAEVEDRKKYLGNILQGEGITDEVKRELFEYVGALTRRDAIKSGKVKQVSEGEDSAENVIVDDEVEEHYENGYNIISPNEKNNAKIALEETIKAIANRYPDMTEDDVMSTINSYGETPSEILMYLNDEKRAFSPEYISQVTDYLNAKAQYEGVIDNVRDGMETEIDTQMGYITKNTHLDGNLYNATMKVDDRRVYVTGGNVIVGEDGMIDHQKSDKSIVVRDAQTGRIEMVDVRDMQSVQPGTNAEQHKTQIAEQIKQGYAEKAAAEINGALPFNAGDTYTILNPETGTREEVIIQQADGDLVTIKGVDGKETQTTRDEVQTLVDRERLLSFNEQFQQNSPAAHTNMKVLDDGRVISETSSNDTEVAFDVLDKEGNIIDSDVMPKEEFDKLHDFEKESEVELSDDGLPVVNEETASSSDKSPVLANEQAINANETDLNSVQEPGVVMQDAGILPTQDNVENNSPVQEETQKPMIPVDEEGNPQYHLAPVEVTIEDLTSPVEMDGEIYEPTDEEIDGLVLANKEEASKKFEKLSGKPPKIGANKSKYFAAKKQWTKQVADAKAQVDYWNEVEAQMKLLRQQPGDTTAEDIKAMGEPMTGEELAAMMLGAGKLPLLHSEYKRETGFGNTDASKMFGLFASKEKGGMTIEQAGEQLMLADLESGTNFFDQNDPNAGRNAIIDVLSSARTRGGLIDYIKNNREAMAERERQAEVEADELAKEQWLQDITHMTSEERDLWKQGELLTESNVVPKDGIIEFYNTFVDDILNEEAYDSRRERTDDHRIEEGQSNELGGIYGSREGGYEVLQGEEIVSPGRVEGYQGEPGEVAGRSNESLHPTDDSLQDSSSPGELTLPSGNQEKVSRINLPSRMEGESILDYASRVNDVHVLHKEEQKVNTQPTDAQKEAGNYRKGHIKVDGFDVTIENPQGSERRGVDANGKPWSVTMNNTYGYIRGTKGTDGDHIDLFLGNSGNGVYVVDQLKEDGSFDEHKVMYGFGSLDEAREAYLSNYSSGWKGLGSITGVSKETFKKWVDSSIRKTKPFSEYKSVNSVVSSEENQGEVISDFVPVKENSSDAEVNLPQDEAIIKNTQRKPDKKRVDKIKKARYELMDARRELSMAQSNPFYTSEERQVKQDRVEKAEKELRGLISVAEDAQQNDNSPVEVAMEKLGDIEQEWEDRILDYIYEHYPTQATVTAQTISPEGLIEREAMTKDETLRKMREEADAAFTDADKELSPLLEKENDIIRFREEGSLSEEEEIVKQTKANGTYMKAPNGKPTKLDKSQWVQVRTKAFKKWFGDWEKAARIEKLRNSDPVEITGEEYKGRYELTRESAQQYILNNLRGEYTINDTGEKVKVSKKGAKKVTSHSQGNEAHMQSIVAIPEMIENSVFIEERPAYKDNAQYDSYRYYVTGLKIGGEDYTARITIGVKNGEFYYDHYLTDIEKGNLIEAAQSFIPTEDAPNPSYAGNKDNILFSLLQTNSSKVVDENGEPMVVFHGTRSKDEFYVFDSNKGNPFNQGGHYFSNKRQFAEKFGKIVKEVFLDIKNPNLGGFDGSGAVMAPSQYRDGGIFTKRNTDRYAEKGTKEYIVFNPSQIKSATNNVGTFDNTNDDIRFREVKEKDGSKSLVGLHNISQEKLLKALKLGGFANPSAAVIDINRQTHEGYGEISLVLPSSMIAKSTGRNAGTFSGDAWTPTYPQIERQFTDEGSNRVRDDISKLPKEMQPDVRSAWNSYMDGRNADALAYQFLYEKGEAPELRRIEPVFSEDIRKKVIDADALDDYNERNVALLDAYIDENFDGDRTKFEEYIEARKRILQKKIDEIPSDKSFRRRKAVERLNDIEERGYEYDSVKEFYDKVLSDIHKSGGVDTYHAIQDTLDKINQSEVLSKEYNEWKEEISDRYNINEVLFKGYTSSGNRVYLPHTLENVSRIMKEEGLAGATGWGGSFSKFAAGLMKSVGTLSGIRQQKEKLTTNHDDIDAFREKWEKVYFDLGIKLNPGASAFDDTGLYRVEEIATRSNPKSFAKREYGVELSDEDVQQLKEMTEAIRNEYPAMYFETKFERPVYLNEFAAAVLPDNVSPKVIDAARNAGLQIFSYKSGDEASRDEAVKEASKIDGVRFRDMKTYHGSGAEFDKFDLNHVGEGEGESMLGKGVYTSKSKRIAKNYAGVARNKNKDGNKHLYEVNIPKDNGRNYLDYDKVYTAKEMKGIIEKLRDAGIGVGDIFSKYILGRKANGMNFYRALSINIPKGTDINEALSKVGYVGVKYSTRHDWDGKDMLFSKKSYVVFNPENTNIVGHNQIKSEVQSISEQLHTPVRVINSIDELSDGVAKEAIGKGRKIKGWYDIGAGEVVLYMPNAASIDDGSKTVLHEVVGHKGLRQLLGEENYDAEMMRLFGQLPEDVRRNVADVAVSNYNSDVSIAMDEYLAEQAEKNETPSWWDKVVSAIRDLLRKVGVNVSLSDNDVKYLLWRSRKNLERTPLDLAADIDMRNRLEIGEYNEKGKRFRDDSNPDEEDLFGEPFDGSKGKKPSLLEAYKNRIFELSNRISALERKIDTYESTEELSNVVIEEIKKEIGSDIISEIGKKELNSLLMQVKNAKTKKSLEKIFMNVKKIALAAQSRKLQRMMDKLLALKVQDVNGKNMSIAKNVDDSTRRIFSFIRGKLSDIKKSGLEDDILYLKRENRSAQEEIKRLERTVRDTDDSSVKDEAMSSIEKHKKSIEDNKVRIQELRDEKNELERQIAGATDIDVEKEMSALDEKMDKAAQGEAIWTQGDTERMAALNIISGQIMNKSHDFEIQSIELDIQKRLMNNSDLYKDRMKEVSENKRRIITNAIKENKRQVVALERLITDTRAMQIKQQQMTIEQLEELISNGKNSLLRRTEGEVKRKSHIIGQAIQTVEGKPIDLYDKKSTDEGVLKKFFSAPLGSFEYMCKRVNTKTLGKDGFLYKYFVEGKDGVMEAYNTYVLGMEEFRKRLDEKSKKIFGKEYEKIWSQSDKVVNDSGVHVVDVNNEQRILGGINGYGVRYEIPLSKGQAMYIYQVWKMDDGRTKLELQGFDEESITEIRDFIGDDYIKFADWVQDELLPDLRERYNEKYLEMYGTSLAEIKDYVPLRIAKKSTRQESDLSEDKERKKTLEERAGSLINRVVNTRPVDITMSAFDVLFDHGRQMEEWNAYARVRRDLDAVLSNTTFRNQLDANTRGSFRNFYDAAAVATKTYHPDQNRFMDEVIGKLSKGIVGGNIAWRLSTALKQILSAPAFWGYSQSPRYMKSLLMNTAKMPVTFKWCMDNIPSFKERVSSGTIGNEKLEEKSISKYLDKYIKTGMIPNKMVDAITCSIGAKSIFDYRFGQLLRQGLKEEEARNQALMDADIYYNQTQQSSHPAFLSPMQMSRSIMDRMLTTYQNSNIGYVRKVMAAYYDLTRSLKWKELQKNYMDMYMREGLNKDEAMRKAYHRLLNENKKTAFEAILFAWGMNLLWNIGSQGLLGLFAGDGDDDDDLSKGISLFLTSPIKGMPGGNLLESIASGYGMNPLLVYDELDKFMKEINYAIDEYGLISPEIAFATMEKVSRYGGVDLEVLGNIYLGIEGLSRDGALDDDKMIDFMYMLNSPKSNRAAVAKELYKDETVASFAEKVARANKYISKRDPWEGWVPGAKDLTKRRKKDIEKEYERLHMTDDEKKTADEKKVADKHRRKLKELDDDPFALADYIDRHREEHKLYQKYY